MRDSAILLVSIIVLIVLFGYWLSKKSSVDDPTSNFENSGGTGRAGCAPAQCYTLNGSQYTGWNCDDDPACE